MSRVKKRIRALAGVLGLSVAVVTGGGDSLQAQGFPARLDLGTLDGTNGFVLRGREKLDETGKTVSCAGDINGDGIADFLVGAPPATRDGRRWVGESYLVFGSDQGFPALFELNGLNGSNGVILKSRVFVGFAGMALSGAGDINGDGIDDLLVGAGIASPNFINEAGLTFAVFGSTQGFPATLDMLEMDATDGFTILGLTIPERMGSSVSAAGDLNGDGIADYLLGALGAAPNGKAFAGISYVVYGSRSSVAPDLALLNGENGFVLQGVLAGDFTGASVSNAGDVNGDGWPDMIVGAPRAARFGSSRVGETLVVFGGQSMPPAFDLTQLNGDNGFVIRGVAAGDLAGSSVSGAGDINDDGIGDLLVGSPFADRLELSNTGEAYLLFGTTEGFAAAIDPSQLDGNDGTVLTGPKQSMHLGMSVARAGDVNDDGLDDFVVGAPQSSPRDQFQAGEAYVVFGSEDGFDAKLDLTQLDGSNGFVIEGRNSQDLCGWAVAAAGDVNGDGVDDLLVGAPSASPDDQLRIGEAYVIFGKRESEVAVALAGLSVEALEASVLLQWQLHGTFAEELLGVHVQRALQADGPFHNRNATPLFPAATMQFRDAFDPIETSTGSAVLWYRVVLQEINGKLRVSPTVAVDVNGRQARTGLEPPRLAADGNRVTLVYRVAQRSVPVRLDIIDPRGRLVRSLGGGLREPGIHLVSWDRRSNSGRRIASGLYLVRLRAGNLLDSRKLLLEN